MDDDQLVYLQNLILVSNEAVMDAFGVYEEDQDPVRLAESLKQVCLVSSALCLMCSCGMYRGALFYTCIVLGPLCDVMLCDVV